MYQAPIVRSKAASVPVRRSVGVVALLVSVLVMVPWLLLNALFGAVVLGAKGAIAVPRALLQMIDYAGGVFVGR